MSTITDYDSHVGFWIEGAPYLWAPGDSPETSKRFYILHHNAAALFDENNHILDTTFIKSALFASRLDPRETFSLLPIAHKKSCDIVRDHFLVWVFNEAAEHTVNLTKDVIKYPEGVKDIKKAIWERIVFPWTDDIDLRIEGKRIKELPDKLPLFKDRLINIINPDTSYFVLVLVYDWRFGNPHNIPMRGIKEQIIVRSKGKSRTFDNLLVAAETYNLSKADISRVHIEALKNTYAEVRKELRKAVTPPGLLIDIASELSRLGESPPGEDWQSDRGWRYKQWPDVPSAHIIYDTLVGKRPMYIVRDPGADDPEGESGKIALPEPIGKRPVVLLNKKPKIFPTNDLWKGKTPGDVICFADDPNPRHRPSMEDQAFAAQLGDDVWLYAVLDGHGGTEAAKYFMQKLPGALLEHLRMISDVIDLAGEISDNTDQEVIIGSIESAFIDEDKRWFHKKDTDNSGTTFTGVLVTPRNLITINLGDSRTLILQAPTPPTPTTLHATIDQKPDDPIEKARIKAAGSFVINHRVSGILAVARAFGDNDFKMPPMGGHGHLGEKASVSPVPVVKFYPREGSETILIACDGVFDVMSNMEAMDIFVERESCQDVVSQAISRKTTDNVTAMAIKISAAE